MSFQIYAPDEYFAKIFDYYYTPKVLMTGNAHAQL